MIFCMLVHREIINVDTFRRQAGLIQSCWWDCRIRRTIDTTKKSFTTGERQQKGYKREGHEDVKERKWGHYRMGSIISVGTDNGNQERCVSHADKVPGGCNALNRSK